MLKRLKKRAALFSFFLIGAIWITGCKDDQAVLEGKVSSYNELTEKIDLYIADFDLDPEYMAELPFAMEFEQQDPKAKSETALYMAEQMAAAVMFDQMTDEVIALSGEAVKAYPHPLLLNNFAAMLQDKGHVEEALEFVLLALEQQPDHPVLLTNAANLCIELEDFAAAELYATKALQTGGDFGPAYQVMTTVHLHNGNSELAAETMVKSAKHVFNDVSVHHFESFLHEVSQLDPEQDEYPLHQEFIDELYEIARSNVDTANVNEGIDTPEGQISLKPFPSFGSPEHFVRSWNYLLDEINKLEQAKLAAWEEERAYPDEDLSDSSEEHFFSFEYNLRQIYAYYVLESYYNFKVSQVLDRYDRKAEQLRDERHDQYEIYVNERSRRYETEDVNSKLFQIDYEYHLKRYNDMKQDANILLSEAESVYNEVKQLLEEFWLKSGGLLKYVVDPGTFHKLNGKRKWFIYHHVANQLYDLKDLNTDLSLELFDLKNIEHYYKPSDKDEEEEIEQEEAGPEIKPDLEERELEEFPAPGTIHNIQIGLEHGFYGNDASIAGNHKGYEASIDTMFGARGWDGNFRTNIHRSYTLYGVKAVGSTTWFTDSDLVRESLNKGKNWGKFGLGFIQNDREGKYMTRRGASNRIMDRGRIAVKESGWSLGPLERVEKNERTISSMMVGLSSQKTSVKYKFAFITVSYDVR